MIFEKKSVQAKNNVRSEDNSLQLMPHEEQVDGDWVGIQGPAAGKSGDQVDI